MDKKEANIVKYLIEKGELKIPIKFFRDSKAIQELNRALNSTRAIYVAGQYQKMMVNVDQYFNTNEIEAAFSMIKSVQKLSVDEGLNYQLTNEDQKIIKFLSSIKEQGIIDFLEMAGPYYFYLEVTEEWQKNIKIPELLSVALIMWLFVNSYEFMLHQIDRKLAYYIANNNVSGKSINTFMNCVSRKDFKNHATAELINRVFCEILSLKEDNNSIFGKSSKPKVIRNTISHSNMYYDKLKKSIVLISGDEFEVKEFINQFFGLFNFMISWMTLSSTSSPLDKNKVVDEIKEVLKALSRKMVFTERSYKREFTYYIIDIKSEIENQSNGQKSGAA